MWTFRGLRFPFGVVALASILSGTAIGSGIVLTSGAAGITTAAGQSFNETRGIDITVLSATALTVGSMSLDRLTVSQSATVGARIYNSGTTALVASAQVNIAAGSQLSVNVPISASLASGSSYRVCFFVSTAVSGTGNMFDPAPTGSGGFPYTESTSRARINQAYSIGTDTFPTGANIYVPFITLWDTLQTPFTPYCFGDGTGTTCPCLDATFQVNQGLAGRGCNNAYGSGGASLSSTGYASVTADSLVLSAQFMPPGTPGLFYQGSASAAPGVAFGNGLRCAGGVTPRLEIRITSGSTVESTVQIHQAGACSAGDLRYYQFWYRDISFGTCTSGFNFSSAISLIWAP